MNPILLGAFIGFIFVSLIVPVISVFGVNGYTQLLALYLAPLTGAVVAYFMEEKKREIKSNSEKEKRSMDNLLTNKTVKIETVDKVLKGTLVGIHGNTIVLSKVRDLLSDETQDKMFLDINEVKTIAVEG